MLKFIDILNTPIHPLSLKFKNNKFEKDFHSYYAKKYLLQLRIAHVLAICFYVLAATGDFLLIEFNPVQTIVRLLIALPVFFAGLILSFVYKDFYLKHYQLFNGVYVLVTGISFIYIAISMTSPVNYFLYNGLVVSLIFNYTFIRQDFVKSSIAGSILLLIYFISVGNDDVFFNYTFHAVLYITIINFLGMFIAYAMELDGRKTFISEKNLELEKNKIKYINSNLALTIENKTIDLKTELETRKKIEKELHKHRHHLEDLVKERTLELEIKNIELQSKNKELERFNQIFENREYRIKDLKEQIKKLEIC